MAFLYYTSIKYRGLDFEEVPIWHQEAVREFIQADSDMQDYFNK